MNQKALALFDGVMPVSGKEASPAFDADMKQVIFPHSRAEGIEWGTVLPAAEEEINIFKYIVCDFLVGINGWVCGHGKAPFLMFSEG